MKRILTIAFALLTGLVVMGQGYGAQWVIGDGNDEILNFTGDTLKTDTAPGDMPIFLTCADICDERGNFLYYTNGIYIFNAAGQLVENSDSLSPCPYTFQQLNNDDGLAIPQAALFLPKPGSTGYYYLFHFSADTMQDTRPGTIYYSLIDEASNGGLGAVIQKNVPILKDVILRGGGMTACKHANGRDYWLIMGASVINRFYKFLITPDSILGPYIQDIGPQFPLPNDLSYSKFSQDGTKFATCTYQSSLLVTDFDRCGGEFSNPVTISNDVSSDSTQVISGSGGVEFSPNDRFIYATAVSDVNQYDLWSPDIQDSVQIYKFANSDYSGIARLQLAPNGKIYGSTFQGGFYFLHVINNPDLKGDSCGFVRAGQPSFSGNNLYVPNLINYNLGPLIGSGCDTITTAITSVTLSNSLRILPNPADEYAYVEMGAKGNYEFDLLNATGQLIATKQTRQVDIFDTEALSPGVYFIKVIDRGSKAEVAGREVVIVH